MDRLFYYSKSADKPPGRGANEIVADPYRYRELAAVPRWRQMLSNFYVSLFVVDGVEWNSVEHYFQGKKIATVDEAKGYSFSLSSGSELGRSDGNVARSNRKLVALTPEQLAHWASLRDRVLYDSLSAKFGQNPYLKRVLLATKDAELWHSPGRAPMAREFVFERVREELSRGLLTFDEMVELIHQEGVVTGSEIVEEAGVHRMSVSTDDGVFFTYLNYDPATDSISPI